MHKLTIIIFLIFTYINTFGKTNNDTLLLNKISITDFNQKFCDSLKNKEVNEILEMINEECTFKKVILKDQFKFCGYIFVFDNGYWMEIHTYNTRFIDEYDSSTWYFENFLMEKITLIDVDNNKNPILFGITWK